MAISEAYTLNAVTVRSTALYITTGTTTPETLAVAGVYQLWIDASTMAKGDEFAIQILEKPIAGGTVNQVIFADWSLQGVQSELFITPTFVLLAGWSMTIRKLAGIDKAFTASIRKIS